ncbi:hypothetical protein [Chamaesiphon sp.]|uniref:hypothetical protein n=1 Tax=Chamaesiphon sp. TaxID=2814140 RepID=UPI003593CB4F
MRRGINDREPVQKLQTATEAQKKKNVDTCTKQIEHWLQAAKDLDLGDWTVNVAGRSFLRVEELTRS